MYDNVFNDRVLLLNPNGIDLGKTGCGETTLVKEEITYILTNTNDSVIVVGLG